MEDSNWVLSYENRSIFRVRLSSVKEKGIWKLH
nr:MAG TPA: hypothetical protein [Caudoviricetes sp.]